MKSFTVVTTFFAMFAVAAFALPHGDYYDDYPYDYESDDSIYVEGCNNEGDVSGIANGLLQNGLLNNNAKKCQQNVGQDDY
ncbi:hypothetical protein BDA99DRAFT_607113 [Phascolomyces articulosus]|uniref:Uncharacterized protein n=1 Tax=Phascolomyces articulosus TaxID=60185 RepID=A0AAD5K4K4_9FUNG|nr:hypothetical protein BDA99DRAFT_607113 [Phascolomyces articulosus]